MSQPSRVEPLYAMQVGQSLSQSRNPDRSYWLVLALIFAASRARFIVPEISEVLQETKQPVTIFSVQLIVEGVLIDGFRQHLSDIALNVVGDLAFDFRFPPKDLSL